LTSTLGSAADVVSSQDATADTISSLQNVESISLFSLIGAVVAGAVIILLTMLMIVRERRREIGVLKAIGASNVKVMAQFIYESITLTLMGAVVGLGVGVVAANPVTNLLVKNSATTTTSTTTGAAGGGRGFGGGAEAAGRSVTRSFGAAGRSLSNIHAAVGWSILLYGLLAAIIIAVIGSAIPALLISKIRPAEVMRAE
jgi:putative ABC transport system permease protein